MSELREDGEVAVQHPGPGEELRNRIHSVISLTLFNELMPIAGDVWFESLRRTRPHEALGGAAVRPDSGRPHEVTGAGVDEVGGLGGRHHLLQRHHVRVQRLHLHPQRPDPVERRAVGHVAAVQAGRYVNWLLI